MSIPLMNFGGMASGLDTNTIISQLMGLERLPLAKMKTEQSEISQQRIAWNKISTLAKAVADKAGELGSVGRLFSPVTTSSHPDAVSVSGDAAAGTSMSFQVTSLARAGQSAVTGFTDPSQVIGAGTVTVTAADGTSKNVTLGAGATVTDLAAAVSSTGLATGTVVNTGDPALGTETLFTSTKTGTTGDVTVSLTGFAQTYATSSIRAATDATIVMGTQTLTRSTNTIDDLVPGATLTLKATTTSEVTVSSTRDDTVVAGKVKEFVASLNALLGDMKTYAKGDPTGSADGVLSGDSRLRAFNLEIMRTITSSYGSGELSVLSQVGIRVERDGSLSFNESTFTKALADNADGVADLLTRTAASSSGQMSFVSSTGAAAGSYDVTVTAAATQATITSPAFTTLPAATDFTFATGTKTGTFSAAAGVTGSQLVTDLNTWFTSQGMELTASYDGSAMTVTSKRYGSTQDVSVTSTLWSAGDTGTDVAGTVNGAPATGTGQELTGSGLTLRVTATDADVVAAGGTLALGTLTYNEGLGGVLTSLMGAARDAGGMVPSALEALDRTDLRIKDDMDAFERRMVLRETAMRNRFSAMELALGRLQSNTPNFAALSTKVYEPY